MKTLIVITGPTAVGKTALCLDIARYFDVPIINADSRQLYRELKIGTAAPTSEQLQQVPHYFVGTLSIGDYYSASLYEQDVMALLPKLFSCSEYALLTGGSMLYIDAVCNGIDDIPTVDDDTRGAVHRQFEQLYLRRDKNFGNAREARRIFDEAVEKQSQRLVSLIGDIGFKEEDMFKITTADLPMAQSDKARPLDEVLNELDEFVGMRSVKNSIRRLAVQSMFMKQRAAMGAGKVQQMAMNFILTGNPGTGKTSIARKMGEVLHSMDILPTSRVLEASRATLVGKYMGETPKIVNNMCDKAMGGILFIDEAYTLSDGGDQYGKEAIDTLMKRMEDDRGKFVVIAAGYKNKMDEFLQMNPGLASRFTHKLHIDDYNEDELLAIFKSMAQKEQYTLSPTAEFKLLDAIYKMVIKKDDSWGNAREMRNLLDDTIQRLSLRVSNMEESEVTRETYQIIQPDDIRDVD